MSKLKAVDPKTAEPSKSKILIYGKPGVGKTWASLDFPSVYYVDTEGGANLDHYTDKLKKSGGMYFGPEQGSQDFGEVLDQVKALATEKHNYKTLVIDSLSKVYNLQILRDQERLGDKDAFGASKKNAIRLTKQLCDWVDRIDMNVILIAHEKTLWENGESKGVTFDAWEKLEYELNLCLNIQKRGAERVAQIKKSRLNKFPEMESFTWSYQEFAQRYGKSLIESDVVQIELANEFQVLEVKRLVSLLKIDEDTVLKWFEKTKTDSFENMSKDNINKIITQLTQKLTVNKLS